MEGLDDIFHEAITADEALLALVGGRVLSTCVEVPPMNDDNTDLPYLIITDDPYNNDVGTKDNVWESTIDHAQASVLINGRSPQEVKKLRGMIRHAITEYVEAMENPPYLTAASNEGIAWDWTKPCYHDALHYQCDIEINYEQD